MSTNYGKLLLGRQTDPTYLKMQWLNPDGSSVVFSPIVVHTFVAWFNNTVVGRTVWNNAVQYETPDMGGLTASAIYGSGGVGVRTVSRTSACMRSMRSGRSSRPCCCSACARRSPRR